MLAKERELNKWCSLKKMVQYRPEHVEKYDQIAYSKKANNMNLKQKILPSLFSEEPDEIIAKNQSNEESNTNKFIIQTENTKEVPKEMENTNKKKKSKGKNLLKVACENPNVQQDNTKIKKGKKETSNNDSNQFIIQTENTKVPKEMDNTIKKKKNKGKRKLKVTRENPNVKQDITIKNGKRKQTSNNDSKSKKIKTDVDSTSAISDARLSAYGINPKKYKNKLKYGNKNS